MWRRGAGSARRGSQGPVGAVGVVDQVDLEAGGDFSVDLGEELRQLDRAVPAVQRGDDLPGAETTVGEGDDKHVFEWTGRNMFPVLSNRLRKFSNLRGADRNYAWK